VRGNVKGAWLDGTGRILTDEEDRKRAIAALRRKYGWQIRVLDFFSFIGRRLGRRAFLELSVPK
jgi:hypothetical protein